MISFLCSSASIFSLSPVLKLLGVFQVSFISALYCWQAFAIHSQRRNVKPSYSKFFHREQHRPPDFDAPHHLSSVRRCISSYSSSFRDLGFSIQLLPSLSKAVEYLRTDVVAGSF